MSIISNSTKKKDLLDTNASASAKRLEELKKNRVDGDIPLNDEYWIALQKHRKAYGK
jgi:hypothetical protein